MREIKGNRAYGFFAYAGQDTRKNARTAFSIEKKNVISLSISIFRFTLGGKIQNLAIFVNSQHCTQFIVCNSLRNMMWLIFHCILSRTNDCSL